MRHQKKLATNMISINHKMLVLAREARGFSQSELSKSLDKISQATYSRMEKGLINITDSQLKEIANALNFPITFFSKELPLTTHTEYYYRKKASLPKKEQTSLEATFSLIRLLFNEMLTDIDIPEFSVPEIEIEHTNTPELIANMTRRSLGIERGPIGPLINALEKKGIIVYFLDGISPKFDGTTIITESNTRIIVLNGSMPNYRKRFTIAHELAHIVCHIPFTSSSIDPYRDIENEANRFASEFLMPEEECTVDLFRLSYSKLSDIKSYWNVSKSAIIRRAHDTGCITKDKYTHLMIELSRHNERRCERNDVPLDEPKILKSITNAYFNELGYTSDELMKSLAINKADFEKFIFSETNVRKLRIAI